MLSEDSQWDFIYMGFTDWVNVLVVVLCVDRVLFNSQLGRGNNRHAYNIQNIGYYQLHYPTTVKPQYTDDFGTRVFKNSVY